MSAPAGETTQSFGGLVVPPDVQDQVLNLLISGAPFANSLTRLPTTRSQVGFPVAAPSGFGWVGELEPIPLVTLNDDAYTVAVAKIAGLIDLSNELIDDASVNVTSTLGTLLSDSLSHQLDQGLLVGTGAANHQPVGVLGVAASVPATSLLAGVAEAAGQIADSGGSPTTVAMSGAAWGAANATTTTDGALVYPNGFAAAVGLTAVTVPGLTMDALVYDKARLIFVLNRQLSQVDLSKDYHFANDATSLRVKARATVACPAPAKSVRKVTVTAGTQSAKSSK